MRVDVSKIIHPARQELMAYAETLVDRMSPLPAAMAAHLASCPACAAEVQAMRKSLEFVSAAPRFEPSTDLTAQILLASRKEISARPAGRRAVRLVWTGVRAMAFAAALVCVLGIAFAAALGNPAPLPAAAPAVVPALAAAGPTPEAIRQADQEVRTLAAAVRQAGAAPRSAFERERLRAVSVLDGDLAAARAALERNPACERASEVVHATLRRQAETLRELYVRRSL